MAVSQQLAEVGTNGELGTGLVPDESPDQGKVWENGVNLLFRDRGVESTPGFSKIFTEINNNPIRGMLQQRRTNLTQQLHWGDTGSIYTWDTVDASETGTGYSGNVDATATSPATVWSFAGWGNFTLATNGVDTPQIDENDGNGFKDWVQSDSSALPFSTAELLAKTHNHVLAINLDTGFNVVQWCDQGDVKNWTIADDTTAGSLVIREATGPIKAAKQFSDSIALYTDEQMILVNFTGQPFYFGYQVALNGLGAVSKQAVVQSGRTHYGLGRQGLWRTDGTQFQYIDRGFVAKYLQENVNWDQASKVSAGVDEENNRIIWCYPKVGGSGENDECVVFNTKNQTFSFLDFQIGSMVERDIFDWPIFGNTNGEVFSLNVTDDKDGSAFTKSVLSKPISLGTTSEIKYIDSVTSIFQTKSGKVEMRVGAQDRLNETPQWSQWFELKDGGQPIHPHVSGRWMRVEVRSTDAGVKWALDSLRAFGTVMGGAL